MVIRGPGERKKVSGTTPPPPAVPTRAPASAPALPEPMIIRPMERPLGHGTAPTVLPSEKRDMRGHVRPGPWLQAAVPDRTAVHAQPQTDASGLSATSRQDWKQAAQALERDPAFLALAEKNSGAAMRQLFTDPALPGHTAQERLDFILWFTSERPHLHFRKMGDKQFNDSGFRPDVKDGALYDHPSNQVGHFLTAADLAQLKNPAARWLGEAGSIGHEQVGDRVLGAYPTKGLQVALGAVAMALGQPRSEFRRAVDAARRQDNAGVKQHADRAFLPGAAGLDAARADVYPQAVKTHDRMGNSLQDMRLTAYGYAMGEMIRDGTLKSGEDVARWLDGTVLVTR